MVAYLISVFVWSALNSVQDNTWFHNSKTWLPTTPWWTGTNWKARYVDNDPDKPFRVFQVGPLELKGSNWITHPFLSAGHLAEFLSVIAVGFGVWGISSYGGDVGSWIVGATLSVHVATHWLFQEIILIRPSHWRVLGLGKK